MAITLRLGQVVDLPTITAIDVAAHPNHPIVSIPFASLSDCRAVFLDRYTYCFNHPKYHFIVATSDEEIVGFLLYKDPGIDDNIPKWEPKHPEGTNLSFFEKFIPAIERDDAKYDSKGLYVIDTLAVSPAQQRRGVGTLLLKEFLKAVDSVHAETCVVASAMGRPLYERFGWKVVGEFRFDLSDFGRRDDYVSHPMKRDAVE